MERLKGIKLVNRHGRVVDAPATSEKRLLKAGYRKPTEEELAAHDKGREVAPESAGDDLPDVTQHTKAEWLELAEKAGVEVDAAATKAEIREALSRGR